MNRITRVAGCAVVLALATARIAGAGGPAQVRYDAVPRTVTAGREIEIPFTVTACGQAMEKLKPRVTARCGRERRQVVARPTGGGRYLARLALPHAGEWTIAVTTGLPQDRNGSVAQVVAADGPGGRTAARTTR